MDLVCGVGVPNDQFAVLRGGNEVSAICGPVHGVNLREMALEGASSAHENSWETVDISSLSTHLGDMSHYPDNRKAKSRSQLVSADASRLARIFSFSASASLRAAAMRS